MRAGTKIREDHGAAEVGYRPRQTRSAPRSEMASEKGQADRYPSQPAVRAMPRQTEALNENKAKSSNGNILADSKDVKSQKPLTLELLQTKISGLDSSRQKTVDHTIKATKTGFMRNVGPKSCTKHQLSNPTETLVSIVVQYLSQEHTTRAK